MVASSSKCNVLSSALGRCLGGGGRDWPRAMPRTSRIASRWRPRSRLRRDRAAPAQSLSTVYCLFSALRYALAAGLSGATIFLLRNQFILHYCNNAGKLVGVRFPRWLQCHIIPTRIRLTLAPSPSSWSKRGICSSSVQNRDWHDMLALRPANGAACHACLLASEDFL